MLLKMRVWVGITVGLVGSVGWVQSREGYGRLGWGFDFSIGGSFTFKRQNK